MYRFIGASLVGLFLCFSTQATSKDTNNSEQAVKAVQSLLVKGTRINNKMAVAGKMGHILISEDEGKNWKQAKVPYKRLLTSVYFVDKDTGFSVGHEDTILKSVDGGKSWRIVYNEEKSETPLLDVWFSDKNNGFAVGAYGKYLATTDGGNTWSSKQLIEGVDEPEDFHLNSVAVAQNGYLFIAAEAGSAYMSKNLGQTWQKLYPPYVGSFFGVKDLKNGSVVFLGLQGHAFVYNIEAQSWKEVPLETRSILNSATTLPDGRVLFVGNDGTMVLSDTEFQFVKEFNLESRQSIADVIALDNDRILLVGDAGVTIQSLKKLTK